MFNIDQNEFNLNDNKNKSNVCIISFPWASNVPYKFISDILKIIEPLCDTITLIDGNIDRINTNYNNLECLDVGISMHYAKDIRPKYYSMFLWFIKCIIVQIKTSVFLVKKSQNFDTVIYYGAYPYHLLPLITSKILGIKTIEIINRSKSSSNSFLNKIFTYQDKIIFKLLDGISPQSNILIKNLELDKYGEKILTEGSRFVDTAICVDRKKYEYRDNLIGYIGRIRKEKGLIEFMASIPQIAEQCNNPKFFIGGGGDLMDWVVKEAEIIKTKHDIEIEIMGWIPEEQVPKYLNSLKLLVLPTIAEGLPTIILESMAVGVPVLATPVGAIPDVIIDGYTGFIMEKNTPECIAKNVIRALKTQNIEYIIDNAKKQIENKYTYAAAVNRFEDLLKI